MRVFLAALMIIAITGTQAQGVELERIVVTGRRSAVGVNELSENVEVADSDEIEQLPAQDLGEALKYVPGVDIEPRSGFGQPTSISIQGSDSRQVRVMIDGIPFNSLSSGQVNPSVLPIENIDRIEVIKGASSSVWGSSLGGTINAITKDTGKTAFPSGNLTTTFAEFHTWKENGELSGKIGALGYYFSADHLESGRAEVKNNTRIDKDFGKLSYDLEEKGKLAASFGYISSNVNSGIYPDGTWEERPYQARYGKLSWELDTGDKEFKIDLKHSRQTTITKSFLSFDAPAPYWRAEFHDLLYQLSLNSGIHLRDKDLLVLGADFDSDTLKSNLYLTKAKGLQLQAPYANYTLVVDPWDLNFGMRYDRNSEFGEEVSPSFGVVYHLKNIPETLLRFEVAHAFNAPPLLWKYEEDPLLMVAPNPDIKAERAWVYEAGIESRPVSRLWLKFSGYLAEVKDALASAQNAGGYTYMANLNRVRRQGLELQAKFEIIRGLQFFSSAAVNDIENKETGEMVRGGGKPRQSFNFGFEYKHQCGFSANLKGYYTRWNSLATTYYDPSGNPVTVEPNDRKVILDLRLTQDFKHLTLFFNLHNLTNSKYWDDYYFPLPKRYFEGGFTLRW